MWSIKYHGNDIWFEFSYPWLHVYLFHHIFKLQQKERKNPNSTKIAQNSIKNHHSDVGKVNVKLALASTHYRPSQPTMPSYLFLSSLNVVLHQITPKILKIVK